MLYRSIYPTRPAILALGLSLRKGGNPELCAHPAFETPLKPRSSARQLTGSTLFHASRTHETPAVRFRTHDMSFSQMSLVFNPEYVRSALETPLRVGSWEQPPERQIGDHRSRLEGPSKNVCMPLVETIHNWRTMVICTDPQAHRGGKWPEMALSDKPLSKKGRLA
jgi:hypothetical protein